MICRDIAAHRHAQLLAALLDHAELPWRAGEFPPLAHWLLFPPDARQSLIGTDGHPARADGGLPRRMWAGSRVRFLRPILLGDTVERRTTVVSEVDKAGKSGPMRFVTLSHVLSVNGAVAAEEEQSIVYRAAAPAEASARPPAPGTVADVPAVARQLSLGPVELFRFSALTFNAHRIHYDRDYARSEEGYPGLVVHGPYIATLLMDHFMRHRPHGTVRAFSFKALRPIFDGESFTLGLTEDAKGADLVAIDAAGGIATQARIDL